MVKREPNNSICKLTVPELKKVAIQNNVYIKDKNGKPKLKCDLIVDIITNILTEYVRDPIKYEKKFKQKSNVKKSSTNSIDVDEVIKQISNSFNDCLKINYENKFKNLNKNDIKNIRKCCEIYKNYDNEKNDASIITSIIIYYYILKGVNIDNHCVLEFCNMVNNITGDDCKKMVDAIIDEESTEMQQIRNELKSKKNKTRNSKINNSKKTRKSSSRKSSSSKS